MMGGGYKKILCSVSGGADSDVMMDLIHRVDVDHKVDYVWFDTGMEYQATKDHLEYLEERYCVDIKREKAIKPIPLSCKEYGQPFLTKDISETIYSLQLHDFDFKNDGDKDFEYLVDKYNVTYSIKWWCNKRPGTKYNIESTPFLKEFMIEHPPWFKISKKCCDYAKKNVSKKYIKKHNYDCSVIGVRKAEGGIRATTYKNCFSEKTKENSVDNYRPLFWYKIADRVEYEKVYHIVHSDCYTKYGLTRTGCAGCPYGIRELDAKIHALLEFEPKLYIACKNTFKDSYKYTQMYLDYRDKMKNI